MVQNLERSVLSYPEVVPWRDVVTNLGGYFNPRTSSFICPLNGDYIFSVTILTHNDHIQIKIFKNNEVLIRVLADNDNSNLDSGSGSVVTECVSGDVVWVQVGVGGKFDSNKANYNFFSGFLLNKL